MLLLHKARCVLRGAMKAAMCNGNADMGGDLNRKLCMLELHHYVWSALAHAGDY